MSVLFSLLILPSSIFQPRKGAIGKFGSINQIESKSPIELPTNPRINRKERNTSSNDFSSFPCFFVFASLASSSFSKKFEDPWQSLCRKAVRSFKLSKKLNAQNDDLFGLEMNRMIMPTCSVSFNCRFLSTCSFITGFLHSEK